MQGFKEGSSIRVHVKQLQAELEAQKRETEEARRKCNEERAKLVEVESQLVEERRKREEAEARLMDRQIEMHEISMQVQTAIQAALFQHKLPLPVSLKLMFSEVQFMYKSSSFFSINFS